jgi:hypothetical protein
MTPKEAREWIALYSKLALVRLRLEDAEQRFGVKMLDEWHNDAVIVKVAEAARYHAW